MTLVKTKHRLTSSKRKVNGDHHRKGRAYAKTYWPYLPIVVILTGSVFGSDYLPVSYRGSSVYNSRLEAFIGRSSPILVGFGYVLLIVLLSLYVRRHLKKLKQLATRGERYLARHYVFDIASASIIGGLYILIR